jgi:predicted PhzF superfamily epimerase YddE/YHI9
LIVTAEGKDCDFVSRFFAPAFGIDEDPVTGSAHTTLVPYWAKQLGKVEMEAVQVSARRGKLHCTLVNDRVELTGKAVLYLKGEMYLEPWSIHSH